MVPALPKLEPVPESIPQQYEFSWVWDDTAEIKLTEYGIDEVDFWQEKDTFWGDPGFEDTSLLADFGDNIGEGEFLILYADINLSEEFITNWSLDSGADLFDGKNPSEFAASEDFAHFTVIPEPSTLVMLLMFGSLTILRRCKLRN